MVKRLFVLGKEAGFSGLFAGLGPRISELPNITCNTLPLLTETSYDCRAGQLAACNV